MLLLAIDTSGKSGSIALARSCDASSDRDDVEVIEVMQLAGGTFSAPLVPQIAELLAHNRLSRNDLDAFAVVSGPGSFTGLRIGLAVAKALAEVLEKPIVPISLLELCGFASGAKGKVMAVLDAGRSDVYVGLHDPEARQLVSQRILSRREFLGDAEGWQIITPDPALAEACKISGLPVLQLPAISAAD